MTNGPINSKLQHSAPSWATHGHFNIVPAQGVGNLTQKAFLRRREFELCLGGVDLNCKCQVFQEEICKDFF